MRTSAGYSQVGGLRVGSGMTAVNATSPLAKLRADAAGLEIASVLGFYDFPKASIRRLTLDAGFPLSKGLRIEHTVATYPDFFVFWTLRGKKLAVELERLGYESAGLDELTANPGNTSCGKSLRLPSQRSILTPVTS